MTDQNSSDHQPDSIDISKYAEVSQGVQDNQKTHGSALAASTYKLPPVLERFIEHCHMRNYSKGERIVSPGVSSDSLFCVKTGQVSVIIEANEMSKQEMVMRYLGRGEIFGEMGVFETNPVRSALVRAKVDCELAEMSYAAFRHYATQDPEILFYIGAQLVERLQATTKRVGDLAFMDASGRIAGAILDMCKHIDAIALPEGTMIRVTRQELAKLVGCSREMVGRILKTFEDDGLVTCQGKSIVVHDIIPIANHHSQF
ncbi:MAG TPA: transcriptional regulator Crp [Gammaproteobacteria bacterium]|nr:cyclic nucleotide-binding domain-containing protein [Pseudomonadota bacterium]HBF09972.1 transcriptional regulator Crp [Gammaproteobacteria bacterium]HCK92683.1 transcriptional regulator Crp [Gammaproteobacteria bacterium]|tara:strand:- start:4445 stop:5218 length:774 start_codon:yes stop_codon:yes gene_type:complete